MSVPLMHLVPLIQGLCISGTDASGVLLVMLAAAILGRVAFGRLADLIGPIPAYMVASLWQASAVFAFTLIGELRTSTSSAPLYGFGYAGVMTTPADHRAGADAGSRRGDADGRDPGLRLAGPCGGRLAGGVPVRPDGRHTTLGLPTPRAASRNLILVPGVAGGGAVERRVRAVRNGLKPVCGARADRVAAPGSPVRPTGEIAAAIASSVPKPCATIRCRR
jgi:hypothetical protein